MSDRVLRSGNVFVQNHLCGKIQETDAGYVFYYLSEWLCQPDAVAVSLTLPLQKEPYTAKNLFPFFDGLIPEGWLLDLVSRNWKISRQDRFGLLLAACRDCIGDVRIEEDA
ncbi:MAG: HipA N-terminal domain-containing protein [Lactimicrobium sp.]|jgi:serine/threonine-protein kinase HipA|uniref:HipA N-terminal domain-containing protein n=1 Tax=Lactimicrobium sp. TaxID=2563780 RepID=UPI002F35BE6B